MGAIGNTTQSGGAAASSASATMKAFNKAAHGKSVVVLTEQAPVRKAIMRSLMAAEVDVVFAKSTVDLWQRLRDQKDLFHVLFLDLEKSDLQVETVLRTARQFGRYEHLPVVVLSPSDMELSDFVQHNCSFVVFKPLVLSMIRDSLLWCFNRAALEGRFRKELALADSRPQDAS